eukprot:m.324807 g.324807  ORF g.324807 m.324807 type:complete len:80 (+) comp55543_c0_seq10:330-569(+)
MTKPVSILYGFSTNGSRLALRLLSTFSGFLVLSISLSGQYHGQAHNQKFVFFPLAYCSRWLDSILSGLLMHREHRREYA